MRPSCYEEEIRCTIHQELLCIVICKLNELQENDFLLDAERIEHSTIRHEKRKKEFAVVRKMKNKYFPNESILYTPSGKPYLEKSLENIGISHTKQYALFAFSKALFGCDIEEKDDRLLRIEDKYTTPEECSILMAFEPVDQRCMLWTCKEAIFKLIGVAGIHWREQCRLVEVHFPVMKFELSLNNQVSKIDCYVQKLFNNAWISIAYLAHE